MDHLFSQPKSIVQEYILPYLRYTKEVQSGNRNTSNNGDDVILQYHEIDLLMWDEGSYYNVKTNPRELMLTYGDNNVNLGNVYAVDNLSNMFFVQWEHIIDDLSNDDFPIPMFIYNECDPMYGTFNGTAKYTAGIGLYNFDDVMVPIMADFVAGNDLAMYDNWQGRCVVTLKPVTAGVGGWLRAPRSMPHDDMFMSADDREYYDGSGYSVFTDESYESYYH